MSHTNYDGGMISSRRRTLFVVVEIGDFAPKILLNVEDEHVAGAIGEASRFGQKATE